jgi:hypothetical protein
LRANFVSVQIYGLLFRTDRTLIERFGRCAPTMQTHIIRGFGREVQICCRSDDRTCVVRCSRYRYSACSPVGLPAGLINLERGPSQLNSRPAGWHTALSHGVTAGATAPTRGPAYTGFQRAAPPICLHSRHTFTTRERLDESRDPARHLGPCANRLPREFLGQQPPRPLQFGISRASSFSGTGKFDGIRIAFAIGTSNRSTSGHPAVRPVRSR